MRDWLFWVIGLFGIIFIVGLFFLASMLDNNSLEKDCKEICIINGDEYYSSNTGGFSPDVCLCRGEEIYSFNIG